MQSPNDDKQHLNNHKKTTNALTKGVAMSFGFKKRPLTAHSFAGNPVAARRLAGADFDGNGNTDTQPLTPNSTPIGRTTPKLAPPKKEAIANTRVSRFGFRQPNATRLNKIADINAVSALHLKYKNNNEEVIVDGTPTVRKDVQKVSLVLV